MKIHRIYGVDFGTGAALAIHGPDGLVSKRDLVLPRVPGGKTPADEFRLVAYALMTGTEKVPAGSIVIESPTIGSSGCEPQDIARLLSDPLVKAAGTVVFTVSARTVKNYRMTHGLVAVKDFGKYTDRPGVAVVPKLTQESAHESDAEIIYRVAIETPWRLYEYDPAHAEVAPIDRLYTSVRPMDKRGYRDERSEHFMRLLPPFASLPADLQEVLGVGNGTRDYSRSMVMPFAMATDEAYLDEGPREERRRRFEKIVGLYDRGYPSFYRRATVDWMIEVLKLQTGLTRKNEANPEQRKAAWKVSQRQIRKLFHLTMTHQGR